MQVEGDGASNRRTTVMNQNPVAYVATVWALAFAGFHLVWAAGWYIGLDPVTTGQAFQRPWFLAYDLVAAALCALAALVALALVRPWGRRLPRRPLEITAVAGTVLLVLRGGGGAVQAVYWAATGRDVWQRSLIWEVWFCLGAVLFWLTVRRYWRGPRRAS